MKTGKRFSWTSFGLPGTCLLVCLFAACSNAASPPNVSNASTAAPANKQVLRTTAIGGDFYTLDPALTPGNGDPLNLIFTGLVEPKDDGTITPVLASSYDASTDGLTYTFHLRPNLKFSDGTALTAQDVAYSINRTVLPATKSSVSSYLQLIKDYDQVSSGKLATLINDSVIVKDPDTLVIIINKPAAYFLETLAYPTSYVVEKKLIDKYGTNWTDHLQEGGGDGPFKVQSYSHTTGLVVVANSNFSLFQPRLQKISYAITGDRDSTYRAFEVGQFDLAPVPPTLNARAKTKPGFQEVAALASRFIGLNELVKPLDNLKIRQALALAINKDVIIGHIVGPSVTPSNHIVPDGIPGYYKNLTGPNGSGTAGDQTKATSLFAEGLKEEGYSSVSNVPALTLRYALGYQAGADTMSAIVAAWSQTLGINIKLQGVDGNELIKEEGQTIGNSGPLQLWYGNWGADYPDPQDWLTMFFGKSSQLNTFNYGQNKSPENVLQQQVQTQLARADIERDAATRNQLYNDAEQKIVNDASWITTYQSSYSYSVNPKLKNWKINSLGSLSVMDWANVYFVQ
jgi:ABC-type transport system substrate-binding protein